MQTPLNFTVSEPFPLDNHICLETGTISECDFFQSMYRNSDSDNVSLLFWSYEKKKFLHYKHQGFLQSVSEAHDVDFVMLSGHSSYGSVT